METIRNWSDIRLNVLRLEKYKYSKNIEEKRFYRNIIRRGRCFVALETRKGFIFAPSRFIGYINNNMKNHEKNYKKDGRITNVAIDKILGSHGVNSNLEKEFKIFCDTQNIDPTNNIRKYWNLSIL
jgi:hypothetical protein